VPAASSGGYSSDYGACVASVAQSPTSGGGGNYFELPLVVYCCGCQTADGEKLTEIRDDWFGGLDSVIFGVLRIVSHVRPDDN